MPRFEKTTPEPSGLFNLIYILLICDVSATLIRLLQGGRDVELLMVVAIVLLLVIGFHKLFYYFGMELSAIEIEDGIVMVRWKTRSGKVMEAFCHVEDLYYRYGSAGSRPPRLTLDLIKKSDRIFFQPVFARLFDTNEWNLENFKELELAYKAAGIEKEPGLFG